jgi:hypothetical protein
VAKGGGRSGKARKEDRQVQALAAAAGRSRGERAAGVRLSASWAVRFSAGGREGWTAAAPRPRLRRTAGDFDLERDSLLRRLAGLWVDEEERAVARVLVRNTSGLRFALGIGATVSSLSFDAEFRRLEEGAWLPRSMAAAASGKKLLFRGFRVRTTTTYASYRRFEVEVQEDIRP